MALHVTQCPRCESTFNTSARVLEAAHGLVRCGACLSIFEADQHFVDPLPDASNDENGQPGSESVFISAPEEYFDPADFLTRDEQPEDGEGELLYAKSDVHDSNIDVFDTDPVVEDSRVREQLLDSDFDVFDVSDAKKLEQQTNADIQDNEFDIYDAGERVLTRPPESRPADEVTNLEHQGKQPDLSNDAFQLKATFSFSPGMPQAIFVPPSNTGTAETEPANFAGNGLEPAELEDQSEKTLPPELPDDSVVILPPGPDAATLLAELKESNDQSISEHELDESELTEQSAIEDSHPLTPEQGSVDEIEALDATTGEEFDFAVDDFSEALSDGLEWEDADQEVDDSSFVILPEDPYQPSAFLYLADEATEPSPDAAEQDGEIEEIEQLDGPAGPDSGEGEGVAETLESVKSAEIAEIIESTESTESADKEDKDSETDSASPVEPDSQVSVQQEVPTLTDFVSAADEPAAANTEDFKPGKPDDDAKDVIRSHVMASKLNEQEDSLQQLSEENLRAVRDVDTALELEQRKHRGRTRAGRYLVGGFVSMLLAALVFFWIQMPQLSQDPLFRPWYQTACNLVGCTLPDYVNSDLVETSNLVVRSHPQREDTLELTAVFRNAAQFPQPFPLIELTFSDLSNRPMMVFEFLPDEYLPQALRGMPLMPVGAPVQITLDLADPGADAVNYQMAYKAAPPRPR
ncbi:MAG: DUF3426 domain-containing protein [Gammaproteobacteria bacterium]|nr:DUF3426 domain-containing protein [Gammaproteobacteria bacterium]